MSEKSAKIEKGAKVRWGSSNDLYLVDLVVVDRKRGNGLRLVNQRTGGVVHNVPESAVKLVE